MEVIWIAVGIFFMASGEIAMGTASKPFTTEAECRQEIARHEAQVRANTKEVLGYALSCTSVTPKRNEPNRTKEGKALPDAPKNQMGRPTVISARI